MHQKAPRVPLRRHISAISPNPCGDQARGATESPNNYRELSSSASIPHNLRRETLARGFIQSRFHLPIEVHQESVRIFFKSWWRLFRTCGTGHRPPPLHVRSSRQHVCRARLTTDGTGNDRFFEEARSGNLGLCRVRKLIGELS